MVKQGDIVRFLNTTGGGRVIRVAGQMAYVEDEDGFEVPALVKECVVVAEAGSAEAQRMSKSAQGAQSKNKKSSKTSAQSAVQSRNSASAPMQAPAVHQPIIVASDPEIEIEETEHGDKLNVVLAFEPADLKQLSDVKLDCVLVNDSNYWLAWSLALYSEETKQWTLRRAGVVEPNIVLSVGEFVGSDFSSIDRLNVQFIAYKEDRPMELKRPVSVIHKVDATKFFKLHCYTDNIYFDGKVIAFDIVKDDEPYRSTRPDARQLEDAMRKKASADRRPMRRPIVRRAEQTRRGEAIVVDLHIDELVDSTRGLSAADMLNLQVDEFRRVMDANLKNSGQKIIFIHGKGEGVLRQAIMKELNYRYKGHQVEDAPFRDYGSGATMVII